MNYKTLVSTPHISSEEWIAARRKGIGGSDAAAILGMNKWVSPIGVYFDKIGELSEREETEAMRQGRDLEEYVASRFCEQTGKKVRRCNAVLQHAEIPFMLANIDRFIVGEDAGLECKTTSVLNLRQFKNGEYPESYYCQCVHYMAVTGASRWYLAVIVLNEGFYVFTIERNEAEIAALIAAETEFWNRVITKTPPPPDGSDATTAAINEIYSESDGAAVVLFGRESVAREYQEIKGRIAELRTRQKQLAQILKMDMQSAELGECGPFAVRWKNTIQTSVSLELLRKRYPKLNLSKVMTARHGRRFSIKEQED
jgi:putative phage-type endonuclease